MVIFCEPPCTWTVCVWTVLYTKTREQIFIRLYLVTREYASVSVERGEKGTFSEGFARFFNRTRGRGAKRTATPRKTFSKDNRGGQKRRKGRKGGWRRKLANRPASNVSSTQFTESIVQRMKNIARGYDGVCVTETMSLMINF